MFAVIIGFTLRKKSNFAGLRVLSTTEEKKYLTKVSPCFFIREMDQLCLMHYLKTSPEAK